MKLHQPKNSEQRQRGMTLLEVSISSAIFLGAMLVVLIQPGKGGGLGAFGEVTELSEADWDTVIDICLKGAFFAVKHEARRMIAGGRGGAIVNIASLNSHVPAYGSVAYTCAKAGVEMLSRNAALELARHRVRVNTVSPGLTDTPLTAGFREVAGLEGAFLERIPMRRWGTPDDMAAAALFLASEDAGYISGSNLFVDGAWETTAYPDLSRFRDQIATPR